MRIPKAKRLPPLSDKTDDELRELQREYHQCHDEIWEETIHEIQGLIQPAERERILARLESSRMYLLDTVRILNERLKRK